MLEAQRSEQPATAPDGEVKTPAKLDPDQPFTFSVRFQLPEKEQTYTIAAQQNPKDKNRGWVIDVAGRQPGVKLIGDSAIEIRAAGAETGLASCDGEL